MKLYIEFENNFFEANKIENLEFIEISNDLYLVFLNNKPYFFKLSEIQDIKVLDDGQNKWFFKIHHFVNKGNLSNINKNYEILSPIPGLVVEVLVSENQQVKKGDTLFIIEAMKMRNQIKSPINGIVKTIKVKKGKSVNMKELLAILTPI